MNLDALKASSARHKALTAQFTHVLETLKKDDGLNLDLMTLAKLISSRDLRAIGLPSDLPSHLNEFLLVSQAHCQVIDTVIASMEKQQELRDAESTAQ